MHPKFEDVYEALLLEQADLEDTRREIVKPTWYWSGFNVSMLLLSIALLTVHVLAALCVVAFTVASIVRLARVRKANAENYEAHYRAAVVAPTLQTIATCYNEHHSMLTLCYDGEARVFDDVIDASPLRIYEACERSGSDFIHGTYEGLPFKGSVVTMYHDVAAEHMQTMQDPATLVGFEGTVLRVELPFTCAGTHRLIEGTFTITDWKSAFQKQLTMMQYKTLKKKDATLRELPTSDVTDAPFQERFKLHTSNEDEASQLLTEQVQTALLALLPMIKRNGMTLNILFDKQWMYVVLTGNRYIAQERMHLPLDDPQLRTIYTGLVAQLRIVDACMPIVERCDAYEKD